MSSFHEDKGFTAIELLVVIAAGVVAIMIAIPVMSSMQNGIKVRTATHAYFSSLHLARSEAIKRNARVVLCKSARGHSCDPNGGWEEGWIVFHDVNNNALLDSGEIVIARQDPLSAPIKLSGNSPVKRYVSYTSLGNTKLTSGAFQAGTFTVCTESLTRGEARQIIINSTGKPRIAKTLVPHCP